MKVNPIHCGVQPLLDFLTELFKDSLHQCHQVSSLVNSCTIRRQHPLVSQLLRWIYNSRSRYTSTWDIDIVMQHLKGLGSNADLSLKLLSAKLSLLMALSLASRTSEHTFASDTLNLRVCSLIWPL